MAVGGHVSQVHEIDLKIVEKPAMAAQVSGAAQRKRYCSRKAACSERMDKGVAMALAGGKPALTYQAATALNCTEALRNIMREVVAILDASGH